MGKALREGESKDRAADALKRCFANVVGDVRVEELAVLHILQSSDPAIAAWSRLREEGEVYWERRDEG